MPPALVYTDACGEGHLGACVFDGEHQWVAHAHIPSWMQKMSINVKEMAAALFGLCVMVEVTRGRQMLL